MISNIARLATCTALAVTTLSAVADSPTPPTESQTGWLLPYTLKLGADATSFVQPMGRSMELGLDLAPTPSLPLATTSFGSAPMEAFAVHGSGQTVKLLGGTAGQFPSSGCLTNNGLRLVNCATTATLLDSYTLGATWAPSDRFSVSVDYFSRPVVIDAATPLTLAAKTMSAPASLTMPSPWQGSLGTAEGLDLNLALALPSARLGQLAVGFEVAKILPEANRSNLLGEPMTRAVMDLGWANGDFRGSLVSRYLTDQSANAQDESWTSLDLNLAWRMPWSGSLSVGARNVLDNQAPRIGGLATDSFESGMGDSLGRVPYVRYEQDL